MWYDRFTTNSQDGLVGMLIRDMRLVCLFFAERAKENLVSGKGLIVTLEVGLEGSLFDARECPSRRLERADP